MKIQLGKGVQKNKWRPSVWVLVYDRSTNRILVLKRAKTVNNPDLWNFPGGGIDGQDPRFAAKRELREEAGVRCKKSDLVFLAKSKDKSTYYYLLPVDKTPALRVDKRESSAFKWVTVSELRRLGAKLHKKTAVFALSKPAITHFETVVRSSTVSQ